MVARGALSNPDIGQFVEWVKERSHLTRGVTIGTMMRDEAFHFTRIGTFLERADSTARILTAHQNDLIPGADAGVVPDPYEWSVLLRALSAFEVYRRVYRDVITPFRVAQLLILRDDMPRSLLRCCKEVYQNLKSVANDQSAETERRAGEMHATAAFHPHGGNHRERPAAFSRAVSATRCAISAIASHRISCYPRRRRKRHADAHSARDALPLRAAGQIQRSESAPDAAPRSEPARA